jgi:hypothetical protein
MAETHIYGKSYYGRCPHCGTFRRVPKSGGKLPKHNRYVGLMSRPGSSRGPCPGSGQHHEVGEITKPHWQKAVDSKGNVHDGDGRFTANSAGEKELESHVKRLGDFYSTQGVRDENNDYRRIGHEGRFHQAAPLPPDIPAGEPRSCFLNSWRLAMKHPDLRYVEGYAHQGLTPVHHAWNVNRNNVVVDSTWDEENAPLAHRAYLGVPMDIGEVSRAMLGRRGSVMLQPPTERGKTVSSLLQKTVRSLFDKRVTPSYYPGSKKPVRQHGHAPATGRFAPKTAATRGIPPHLMSGEQHLVIVNGPGGAGKSGFISSLAGGETGGGHVNYGKGTSSDNLKQQLLDRQASISQRRALHIMTDALPGFDRSRVVSADDFKPEVPMYSEFADERGMHGPSGPRNKAEFDQYPQSMRDAMTEFVQQRLGHASIEEFAKKRHGHPERYGGGLTHELSSALAEQKLQGLLRDGSGKSVVYEGIGSKNKNRKLTKTALRFGFKHVTTAFINSHPAVTQENNYYRGFGPGGRASSQKRIKESYDSAQRARSSEMKRVRKEQARGNPVHFVEYNVATPEHIEGTLSRGWTAEGHATLRHGGDHIGDERQPESAPAQAPAPTPVRPPAPARPVNRPTRRPYRRTPATV